MNPLFLTVLIDEKGPNALCTLFLARLPRLLRVRIVLEEKADAVWCWLDLLKDKRVSLDLMVETACRLPEGFGGDPRIRQVRIMMDSIKMGLMGELIRHIRGDGESPPIVFLMGAECLTESPEQWLDIFEWPNVFVNPVLAIGNKKPILQPKEKSVALYSEHFAIWRALLGARMFTSLPAVAAQAADEAAAPCPTKMGLHIVLDAIQGCVRVCDCRDQPLIPLDEDGHWFATWRNEVKTIQTLAADACGGCPLWAQCQGGCIAPRLDDIRRDYLCPWPQKTFQVEIIS